MECRRLGDSDLEVSVVGLGCWSFANDAQWGPVDEAEAVRTVHAALDGGVTLLDTAEGYGAGHSEAVLGRALKGRRGRAVVATKASGSHLSAKELPRALEASLRRLGTQYVDLYQVHWPSRGIPFEETMAQMNRLKEVGKIRSIGVSNFGVGDLREILRYGRVDCDQLPYNLFWRAIEACIVAACMDANVSIMCYSPLAQGLLTGKFERRADIPESNRTGTRLYAEDALALAFVALGDVRGIARRLGITVGQLSLAWAMAQPGVAAVIPGAKTRRQLEENAGAADVVLEKSDLDALGALSRPLLNHLGDDPDLWDGHRYR